VSSFETLPVAQARAQIDAEAAVFGGPPIPLPAVDDNAYFAVAGFDPLRDEGESYAHRMRAAGVPVALHRRASLIHAFVHTAGVGRTGREAMLQACGALGAGVAGLARRPTAAR
jgi:hypothetical protein